MNARQKAKKYKRMYEALLNQPVKFKVEQHKIDTLRFEKYYPEKLIAKVDNNSLREIVLKDITQGLAQCLANNFDKYIDYFKDYCPYYINNEFYYCGEIKVVNKI